MVTGDALVVYWWYIERFKRALSIKAAY